MNDDIRKALAESLDRIQDESIAAISAIVFLENHGPALLKLLEQPAQARTFKARFLPPTPAEIQRIEQEQPAQEPVAWLKHGPYDDNEPVVCVYQNPHNDDFYTPLYATPQPAQASVTEWQPIESAPRDCLILLLLDGGAGKYDLAQEIVSANYYGERDGHTTWTCAYSVTEHVTDPTHWMPLLATPVAAAQPTEKSHD
jgi:hypothetical protein